MTTFYDNFDRANGAPGNGWTALSATPSISGGYLQGNTAGGCYNSSLSDTGKQYAIAHCGWVTNASLAAGPILKCDGVTAVGYVAYLRYSLGNYYLCIGKAAGTVISELVNLNLGATQPYYWSIALEYDNGALTATYNGATTLTWNDLQYVGNAYAGLWLGGTSVRVDDFQMDMGATSGFDVNEAIVGNYGACSTLHLTGIATTWTPGTPGSPTFAVDSGTISDQEVLTPTTATVTYCPGSFLGTATFTDPSTGKTDYVLVTSDPGIVVPPGSDLERPTQPGADLLDDASGGERHAGTVVLNEQVMATLPPMTYTETIATIWGYLRYVATGVNPPTGVTDSLTQILNELVGSYRTTPVAYEPINPGPIKSDTDFLAMAMLALTADGSLSLAQVINILRGSGEVDLTTISDAIAGIGGGSNEDVLARLDEIQGAGGYSLNYIVNYLSEMRTASSWTLGDIISRIDDRPTTAAFLAAIAELNGAIGAIALEIVALAATEAGDAASSTAAAASAATVAGWVLANGGTILDQLSQILGLLGGSTPAVHHPPVWPGAAGVVYGDLQDLQSGLVVPGPMHGVIVNITSVDPGTGHYDYDVQRCWRNIGAVSFVNDVGDHEHWQPLGFQHAFYTPKTMTQAASCKLHLGRGPQGTIRPWSYAT